MPPRPAVRAPSSARGSRPAPARGRPARRRSPRWPGLDVARGLAVVVAAVLSAAAALAPDVLGATAWLGLAPLDLLPGAFLVIAGAGLGWRRATGTPWTAARRRRRAVLLVVAGLLVVLARAGGDPGAAAADELLRLAAATGLAALLLRQRPIVVGALAGALLLVPAAAVTGSPIGRGLRAAAPARGWQLEATLGLPTGGVPVASLPAAVASVLVGVALATWVQRRPPGPATAAALATVAVWCLVATVVVAQVVAPVPVLLTLPVTLGATGAAAAMLAAGHLATVVGRAPGLAGVGRAALPIVVTGTVALAGLARLDLPTLPAVAALTAGGVVAWAVVAVGRLVEARGWTARA